MAFHDWNKDGKNNVQDNFIEYNIYKESSQNNNSGNYGGGGDGIGCTAWVFIGILIFQILKWIADMKY